MKYGVLELCEAYGFDTEMHMADAYQNEAGIPAICTDCGATYEYEPDCSDGRCDHCEINAVQSLFILMGVI